MTGEATMGEESTPVQLTRMEGKIDLLTYKLTSLDSRVEKHDQEIGVLKVDSQRLSEQAVARDATAVALAAALKEAETSRREKSEQTWTPFQRGIALIGGLVTLAALVSFFLPA